MQIRGAMPVDAFRIATLHTSSWQSVYRGILCDEFLDGGLAADRCELWDRRLRVSPAPNQLVLLAEQGAELLAFVCVYLDEDAEWGTLLDNLHVSPALKGKGMGRRLMRSVAEEVLRQAAAPALHLWAYQQNLEARGFYERLGGVQTAVVAEPAPDGTLVNAVRYAWRDVATLQNTLTERS